MIILVVQYLVFFSFQNRCNATPTDSFNLVFSRVHKKCCTTLIHTFTFFLISFLLLLRQEESLLYRDHQPDNKEIISISVPFPIINEINLQFSTKQMSQILQTSIKFQTLSLLKIVNITTTTFISLRKCIQ